MSWKVRALGAGNSRHRDLGSERGPAGLEAWGGGRRANQEGGAAGREGLEKAQGDPYRTVAGEGSGRFGAGRTLPLGWRLAGTQGPELLPIFQKLAEKKPYSLDCNEDSEIK